MSAAAASSARVICLYEEEPDRLLPIVRLRPVWDLRVGALTVAERAARAWPGLERRYAGRSELAKDWLDRSGTSLTDSVAVSNTIFLNGGVAVGLSAVRAIMDVTTPARFTARGAFIGARFGDAQRRLEGGLALAGDLARAAADLPPLELDVVHLRELPDLIAGLGALIRGDLEFTTGHRVRTDLEAGIRVLGDHGVWASPGARIDPGTVLDARSGPISLGEGSSTSCGTWLVGPAAVGSEVSLLGGTIGPFVAIGPSSRLRGELAESFVQGFANKAHDGFVGHSFIGEWVNLGALTTTSDLKNTYSTIALSLPGRTLETNLRKCGAFIGDHVKTAIGTLLTTGAVLDVGANLFGDAGLSPKYVEPFAWGTCGEKRSYDRERFLDTARIVADRRKVTWRPAYEELLCATYGSC